MKMLGQNRNDTQLWMYLVENNILLQQPKQIKIKRSTTYTKYIKTLCLKKSGMK